MGLDVMKDRQSVAAIANMSGTALPAICGTTSEQCRDG